MNKKITDLLLRVVILLVGLTIAHLGVTLFLLADLGADPFNVLVQGIFRTVSNVTGLEFITHGYTHIAMCLVIILVLVFTDRSYIRIGTVLCMVCGGPIIDVFTWMLNPLFSMVDSLWVKIIVQAIGCVILAFGMTLVIKSKAGTGPNDLVAVVISDKRRWKFGIVRIATDCVFVLVGFLLGGVVGIGTLICVFLVGPAADVFLPISEKIVSKIVTD